MNIYTPKKPDLQISKIFEKNQQNQNAYVFSFNTDPANIKKKEIAYNKDVSITKNQINN